MTVACARRLAGRAAAQPPPTGPERENGGGGGGGGNVCHKGPKGSITAGVSSVQTKQGTILVGTAKSMIDGMWHCPSDKGQFKSGEQPDDRQAPCSEDNMTEMRLGWLV